MLPLQCCLAKDEIKCKNFHTVLRPFSSTSSSCTPKIAFTDIGTRDAVGVDEISAASKRNMDSIVDAACVLFPVLSILAVASAGGAFLLLDRLDLRRVEEEFDDFVEERAAKVRNPHVLDFTLAGDACEVFCSASLLPTSLFLVVFLELPSS